MTKRRTPPQAPPPPILAPIADPPAWFTARRTPYARIAHGRGTPGYLVRRGLDVPRFQRDVVWSRSQQTAYVQAIVDGRMLTAPIVIWDLGRRHLVLDGLQRLTALDLPMTRDDGETHPRSHVAINARTGKVRIAQDPEFPLIPVRWFFADRPRISALLRALNDADFEAAVAAETVCADADLSYTTIEGAAEVAFDAMRGLNHPGVVYDLSELEANLLRYEKEYA